MRISYFLYSFLVSIWIFTDAPIYKASRWRWSIGAFILPLLVPYYFIKTRPLKKYSKYIGIWLLGLIVFYGAEFVFVRIPAMMNETKSPVVKEIKLLSFESGKSSTKLQDTLNKLDQIQDTNTIPKVNEVIKMIDLTQSLLLQANKDSDTLTNYINKHKKELQDEGLDIFIEMEGLVGKTYFFYGRALREYLDTYKMMLEYIRDNYNSILRGEQPQSRSYEELYSKYKTSLDKHNKAYLHKMKIVQDYSAKHPKLAEYIRKSAQELRGK